MKGIVAATILCSAILVGGASLASAEETKEPDYGRLGFYGELGGSQVWNAFDDPFERDAAGNKLHYDTSLGLNLHAGYRFWKYISVEAEYEWLSEFQVKHSHNSVDGWALGVNLKGYPLMQMGQPYILLGTNYYTIENTDGAGIRFGAGVDIYATDNVYVNLGLDYMFGLGDLSDVDYVTLQWGLGYRL